MPQYIKCLKFQFCRQSVRPGGEVTGSTVQTCHTVFLLLFIKLYPGLIIDRHEMRHHSRYALSAKLQHPGL